jgi:hypothetical protein
MKVGLTRNREMTRKGKCQGDTPIAAERWAIKPRSATAGGGEQTYGLRNKDANNMFGSMMGVHKKKRASQEARNTVNWGTMVTFPPSTPQKKTTYEVVPV